MPLVQTTRAPGCMQVVQALARGRLLGEGDVLRSLATNTYSLQSLQGYNCPDFSAQPWGLQLHAGRAGLCQGPAAGRGGYAALPCSQHMHPAALT